MMFEVFVSSPMPRSEWTKTVGLKIWWNMSVIREVETRLSEYIRLKYIPGSTHQSTGMEAIAVGVSSSLRKSDFIVSNHRGHAHCLAKGATIEGYIAELFGRATGLCGGKGGSMLLAKYDIGVLGTDAIVGGSIGIATGAALACSLGSSDTIAVSFFGDGAINQGIFHESLNLAAIWKLPCIYLCENNHYAKSCSVEKMVSIPNLARRADSYGIPGINVDGMDVYDVWQTTRTAIERARNGAGPTLIVADTYRFSGHSVGDTEIYRTNEERTIWQLRDPIVRLEKELQDAGLVHESRLSIMRDEISRLVDVAESAALAASLPLADSAFTNVYGGRG